jgi:hypothetical protein
VPHQRLVPKKHPGGTRGGVPKEGFEPSRAYAHYALNVARLPIPPLRQANVILLDVPSLSTFVRNSWESKAAALRYLAVQGGTPPESPRLSLISAKTSTSHYVSRISPGRWG